MLKITKIYTKQTFLPLALIFVVILGSCGGGVRNPDVKGITVSLQSQRLDQDLAHIDTTNLAASLGSLKTKYPGFLDFYLDTIMGFGIKGNYDPASPGISQGLRPFLSHKDIRGLFDTVNKHFPNVKSIENELVDGFRYLKHYHPGYHVPRLVFLVTGLNQWSVFTVDTSFIGIGLDMYLGESYPFYQAVQIPDYVIRKCSPVYIPANVFQAIHRDRHPFVMEERTLLDMMIQRGKEQYFLSKVLPDAPDTIRFGFTGKQMDWCQANEEQVYNFFIQDNLLYQTNWQKVLRYVNDGPNAAGMPKDSPGNIGTWLGWRVVCAFMDKHPDLTMDDLFNYTDAVRLLREAHYKP